MAKPKVLIYFIDGAAWELIGEWLDGGKLPNLKKIKDKSAYGTLKSVFPPTTHTALPAFFTGRDPMKLGLFNIPELDAATLDSNRFKGQFLWEKLSAAGFRSLVVDIPFTYPPQKFNGVLFTGFYTPEQGKDYIYPGALTEEYPDYPKGGMELFKYVLNVEITGDLLNIEKEITQKRFEAFVKELKKSDFDFACFYIKATDILQHYFWREKERLLDFYQFLDRQIGELAGTFDAENFIIMSDHGFNEAARETFFINAWLEKNGYLKWDKLRAGFLKKILDKILFKNKFFSRIFYLSLRHLEVKKENRKTIKRDNDIFEVSKSIDRKNSLAYAVGGALRGKGIVVNAPDKEKIAGEIMEKIKTENYDGQPIAQFIKRKDKSLENDKSLPDIFFLPQHKFFVNDRYSGEVFAPRKTHGRATGHHLSSMDGIFVWQGGVKTGKYDGASLLDIYPTILSIFGLEEKNLDGRALPILKDENGLQKTQIMSDNELISQIDF